MKKAGKESLKERMMKRLEVARFRTINEELEGSDELKDPKDVFSASIDSFKKYHEVYKERIKTWPQDPLDIIIKRVKKMPKNLQIADLGCGEGRLSCTVPHKVYSFDLFALNERVTPCDMSAVPLQDSSIDVSIFCLSLMGTEVGKYIIEANRLLKHKGSLIIAETSTRLPKDLPSFIKKLKRFGFIISPRTPFNGENQKRGEKDVFFILEFMKIRNVMKVQGKQKSLVLRLKPSVYKKR